MYPARVHPDIEELQSKLKEILYDCAVELRSTKAALYLLDAQDGRFELITEYGFRGALRSTADQNDPVVDRCGAIETYLDALPEGRRCRRLIGGSGCRFS